MPDRSGIIRSVEPTKAKTLRAPTCLRIVVSTPTFLPQVGGAEVGIHEIFRRLAEKHDVTIVTPRPTAGPPDSATQDEWAASYRVLHPLSAIYGRVPRIVIKALHRTSVSYLLAIALLRLRGRADVVNYHFIKPQAPAIVALSKLLRVPSVLSLVGRTDVLHLLSWPARAYSKASISAVDIVLQNSAFYLENYTFPNSRVVPYGVDTTAFSPAQRDAKLRADLGVSADGWMLLSVQRLVPVKRVDLLIRAMRLIVDESPDAILVLVGHGEEEGRLVALARELGLEDNVRFAGYVPDSALPHYFASADVFVFHSMLETFGVVFAQAMASGLPIVAAKTSCIPSVVHSANGLLVEPGDIDAFAEAVLSLLGDRDRRLEYGKRNVERARMEFDWDRIAAEYERSFIEATR